MEKILASTRHDYEHLSRDEGPGNEESDVALLEEKRFELYQPQQHRRLVLVNRILAFSTSALIIISLWLAWELHAAKHGRMGSFEYGFKYELGKEMPTFPR